MQRYIYLACNEHLARTKKNMLDEMRGFKACDLSVRKRRGGVMGKGNRNGNVRRDLSWGPEGYGWEYSTRQKVSLLNISTPPKLAISH